MAAINQHQLLTSFFNYTFYLSNQRAEVHTADGTATAGQDYTAVAVTAQFGLGIDSVQVTLQIESDYLIERHEVLFLTLENPGVGEALGSMHKATLTIFDNDGEYWLQIEWKLNIMI